MNWKEFEKFVEGMDANKEEVEASLRRKIRHINFAKAVIYFYYFAKKDGFVYPRDIAKKIKSITTPRAWQILGELEKLGLARRVLRAGERVFVMRNEEEVKRWVDEAIKTVKEYGGSV